MTTLAKQLLTAGRIFREQGLRGILQTVFTKVDFHVRFTLAKWLTGEFVSLNGLHFHLDRRHVIPTVRAELALGLYEQLEIKLLQKYLRPESAVIELGGGLGVVACFANRQLQDPTRHIVIEANPHLLPLIERNRQENNCSFTVIHGVVAYHTEAAPFHIGDNFLESSTRGQSTAVSIQTITFKKALAYLSHLSNHVHDPRMSASPDDNGVAAFGRGSLSATDLEQPVEHLTLVCDIEGAEFELVQQEAASLAQYVDLLIVEVHPEFLSVAEIQEFNDTLSKHHFQLIEQLGKACVYRHAQS